MSQTASPKTTIALAGEAPVVAAIKCRRAFALVLAMATVDVVWNWRAGLQFHGWAHPIGALAAMWVLAIFYSTVRPRIQLAEMALYAGFWVAFTLVGAIQTYLGASLARPFIDAALAHADQAAGFDWPAWTAFVRSYPAAHMLIRAAYYSLIPQMIATIIALTAPNMRGRNEELLLNAGVALILTTLLASCFPAMGTFFHYGIEAFSPIDSRYVTQMIALRQPPLPPLELSDMQGIITFPSFHAVLACLFVYSHRGSRWSFRVAFAVNALMLLAIPSEGGHYLVDVVVGVVVAGVAIGIIALASRWSSREAQRRSLLRVNTQRCSASPR